MCALRVELIREEDILYESERAVLTNKRLLANLDRKRVNEVTDDVPLGDIASFKKSTVGQESRIRPGTVGVTLGVVMLIVSSVTNALSLGIFLESATFLVGAMAVLMGIYFVLSSFLRIKPATTLQFNVVGERDIIVYFPGKDNPEADEMARIYVRAKRGIYQ